MSERVDIPFLRFFVLTVGSAHSVDFGQDPVCYTNAKGTRSSRSDSASGYALRFEKKWASTKLSMMVWLAGSTLSN